MRVKLFFIFSFISLFFVSCEKQGNNTIPEPEGFKLNKKMVVKHTIGSILMKNVSNYEFLLAGTLGGSLYIYKFSKDLSIEDALISDNCSLSDIQDLVQTNLGNYYVIGNNRNNLLFFDRSLALKWNLTLQDSMASFGEAITYAGEESERIYLAGTKNTQHKHWQEIPVYKLGIFMVDNAANISEVFEYDSYNKQPCNYACGYRGIKGIQVIRTDSTYNILLVESTGYNFEWRYSWFANFDLNGHPQKTLSLAGHLDWARMFRTDNHKFAIMSALIPNDGTELSPHFRFNVTDSIGSKSTFSSPWYREARAFQKTEEGNFIVFSYAKDPPQRYVVYIFDKDAALLKNKYDIEIQYGIPKFAFTCFDTTAIYLAGKRNDTLVVMQYKHNNF